MPLVISGAWEREQTQSLGPPISEHRSDPDVGDNNANRQVQAASEGFSIEASFRPRVVEIIGILESHQKNNFRVGPDTTFLSGFKKEIQDRMKGRA